MIFHGRSCLICFSCCLSWAEWRSGGRIFVRSKFSLIELKLHCNFLSLVMTLFNKKSENLPVMDTAVYDIYTLSSIFLRERDFKLYREAYNIVLIPLYKYSWRQVWTSNSCHGNTEVILFEVCNFWKHLYIQLLLQLEYVMLVIYSFQFGYLDII